MYKGGSDGSYTSNKEGETRPTLGFVETSLSLLDETKVRAEQMVSRSSGGGLFISGSGLPSTGITRLTRAFLEDMGKDVNEDITNALNSPVYDNRQVNSRIRYFSVKYTAFPKDPWCPYYHDLEMVVFEELSRMGQLFVSAEMLIGSNRLRFSLPDHMKEGLPRMASVFGASSLMCLTGSIDLMVMDRITGEISVAEVKTKNLPRSARGGYPTCPRLTRADLLQAWFYAHVLTTLYNVPIKNLFVFRTDVTNSQISTTRVGYEYANAWGEEHLALHTLKKHIRIESECGVRSGKMCDSCIRESPRRFHITTLDCFCQYWCSECFDDEEKKTQRRICIACGEDPSDGGNRFNQFQGITPDPRSSTPKPYEIVTSDGITLASICDSCYNEYGFADMYDDTEPFSLPNGLVFTFDSCYRMND